MHHEFMAQQLRRRELALETEIETLRKALFRCRITDILTVVYGLLAVLFLLLCGLRYTTSMAVLCFVGWCAALAGVGLLADESVRDRDELSRCYRAIERSLRFVPYEIRLMWLETKGLSAYFSAYLRR